ncbi:hypothetical protein HIM_07669 [Hirsutella minnesotensis 3608]|uniref:Phosphoinositide phospholipase C n=1 Tax=Hirsutella minnesotensis 3608 TaxID=1043627 RepID=A0A0F7ZHM6_9HYPO|nr:hypothetical protein HIM_07669 [Hirsutella minnesotensis 3608]
MAQPTNEALKSLHIAGGGASESEQSIQTIHSKVLPYLQRIFHSHAGRDDSWTSSQASRFIQSVQQNEYASRHADAFLSHLTVTFNHFLAYMTSPDSSITRPAAPCDLSSPLAHYFISSSHNTYLTGNQLSSDSTTQAYTDVLLRGCRCVEVDVWDGVESDGETSSSTSDAGDANRKSVRSNTSGSRKTKFSALKEKLSGSLASRLEKTSLSKKSDEKTSASTPEVAGTAKDHSQHQSREIVDDQEDFLEDSDVCTAEPRVLHGHTLTKEVSFRNVCHAIRDSAFAVTDLPLIVSLEVHCSPCQQEMMVKIMQEAWRGLLVEAPESSPDSLPSPEKLRGKILIKVKHVATGASTALVDEPGSAEDDAPTAGAAVSKQRKPSKIIHELSKLGVYTQAVSFKAWTQEEATMTTHIFSLSEKKFLEHQDKHGESLFEHNKHYLMRVYPSGLRISSSNLSPPAFWGSGAQVVALNWQQTDEGMMLNEGMFAGTGGYVLKPQSYTGRKPSENIAHRKDMSLSITFLAAQSIPLPLGDKSAKGFHPYVKTEVHAEANNYKSDVNDGLGHERSYKARTRTHHGCDVDLEGEEVTFPDIERVLEQLTFVRFTVRDDELGRDDLAAWACVRLDRLGQGYRFIHLLDAKGAVTKGVILVKVEWSTS